QPSEDAKNHPEHYLRRSVSKIDQSHQPLSYSVDDDEERNYRRNKNPDLAYGHSPDQRLVAQVVKHPGDESRDPDRKTPRDALDRRGQLPDPEAQRVADSQLPFEVVVLGPRALHILLDRQKVPIARLRDRTHFDAVAFSQFIFGHPVSAAHQRVSLDVRE